MAKPPNRLGLFLPPAFLLICFIWIAFYGLNFGVQWDETRGQFDSIRESLKNGVMLQGADFSNEGKNYNHGGVNYLLTWSGLSPQVLDFLLHGPRNRPGLYARIMPILDSTGVRIRVRAIYVVLSSLLIVWVYSLCLLLGRSRLEAFLAAAILTFSWEVAYHSRWIAPDVIMAQFSWLALLCVVAGTRSRRLFWFYLGAVAVGLAMGTKYTGGLALPFFLIGVGYVMRQEYRPKRYILKLSLGLVCVGGLVFVLTNPGVFVDPFRFFYQLQEQREIYSTGWYGYTVTPGLPHIVAMLKYFSLQLFSHFWSISLAFTAFCVLGLVVMAKDREPYIVWMAAFCVAHLIFFSFQSAMLVRNLLVAVPLLAMAAARGIVVVGERVRFQGLRVALVAAVAAVFAVNLGWQIYAARQIKIRFHPDNYMSQFADYTAKSASDTFLISANLLTAMRDSGRSLSANVTSDSGRAYTKVAFYQSEGPDRLWETWPSNAWGMYEKTFGPLEVNLDAYSTFIGNERILVVTRKRFESLPIKVTDLAKR
jgi:hypothetical protein